MYLAITLNRLDDFDNACQAYEKAIEMEEDHLFRLNYAITLFNSARGRGRGRGRSLPAPLFDSAR